MDTFIIVGRRALAQGAALWYNVVMVRVEHVLDSWRTIRQDTAAAVEDFPAGELDYRPTPDVATFREIARHILDASDGLTGMLLAGDENFTGARLPRAPETAHARSAGRCGRRRTGRRPAGICGATHRTTRRQPPEFFEHIITRFDGQQVTRLEMVQTIKEHELTHRAQLFMYLRMKGIVPATTRRRLAKQAGK